MGTSLCRALKITVRTILWPGSWLEFSRNNVKPLACFGNGIKFVFLTDYYGARSEDCLI